MVRISDRVISYEFRGKFASLTAGLAASSKSVEQFGGKLTALDRQGAKMRAGLSTLGSAAGKFGLAAGIGLGAAIAVTAKFESAMSRVSAATNASASDLEALRKAAIKAGADTVFSASEAADGMTELAKAGLSARDILGGGLSGALDLAAAGQISVAQAAETTAITLQQFSLDGSQATRVADTLAAGAGKAVGGVEDMAGALKYVGPVAAQMGLSLEESAGAIAELASQGVIGESAGTALRGMLTSLTSPSKAASNQMKALGITLYDAQGKFVGIDGVAGQLQDTLGGLTEAQRNEALGRLFGNEQITAARILYSGGSADVEKWTKAVTDSGFAAEQANKLTDNLAGDLEQLKGSFETALIETGTGSQGPLRGLVQNLTDVVNGYSSLPGPAQSATSAALGVTAALGGGAFVFSKAIGGLANLQGALVDMGTSAERASSLTRGLGKAAGAAAGLGLFAAGLASTNEELGSLEATAGGAIAGFSVGGPWGAAIGGAIGLVVSLGTSHKDTAKDVAALTSSFDTQTGAITANTEAMVAKKLQDTGAFDSAERLGISTQLVTDAVLNRAGAQEQLNAALAGFQDEDLANTAYEQADGFTAAQIAAIDTARAAQGLADTVPAMSGVFATAADKAKQLAGALGNDPSSGAAGATAQLDAAQAAGFQTGEEYAAAQKAAAKALQDARAAARDTADSFFNLGDSVNDAKVSLGDWIGDLEKQAQALKDFRKNAREAGDNGVRKGLIDALREAGPEGALRLKQLADATEDEVRRANKAWKTGQNQVQAYTDEVGGVQPAELTADGSQARSVLTDVKGRVTNLGKMVARVLIDANTDPAKSKIAGIRRELATIPDENVNVNVRRVNVGGMGPQLRAAGGYIAGPGTATSDSIPARLSNGEYVIKASSVSRYGVAMFDNLNAQRFASGGEVKKRGAQRDVVDITGVDTDGGLRGMRRAAAELERAFNKSTAAADRASEAADREVSARDSVVASMASLASDIAGQFNSNLFEPLSDVWSSNRTMSDPISVLLGDIGNSAQFSSLFAGLQGRGLSGGALTAAAQGGIGGLQAVGAYSDADLARYADLYAQREASRSNTGEQVALAQYGQSLKDANNLAAAALAAQDQTNAELRDIKAQLGAQTNAVKNVEDATKDNGRATASGRRSKVRKG